MKNVKTITLIDDDPISHLISTKIIGLFSSFSVNAYTDAEEALEHMSEYAFHDASKLPDYILLDINMPGMDGWQFVEEFEKLPSNAIDRTCIVMLSSSPSKMDIEKSKTYKSIKHFISKPLTEEKVQMLGQLCHETRS